MRPEHGLTPELAAELIEAIEYCPTFRSACASCGTSPNTVENWLRRGMQPGAPSALADFASKFVRADAKHAREAYAYYQELMRSDKPEGSKLNSILQMLKERWGLGKDDFMLALAQGSKSTDALLMRLYYPSARLRSMLEQAGWTRADDWTPPTNVIPMRKCGTDSGGDE